MPAKNVVKVFVPDSYYHIYNRGVAKQNIFLDQSDKRYFLSILDRHLNPESEITNELGLPYKQFENIELTCYCLVNNHFHFLIHVTDNPQILSEFMRSIGTAYTMYFNLKRKRVGPLFQGTYKASRITNDAYLLHITRYIHRNVREYLTYRYSSFKAYCTQEETAWLKPDRILALFKGDEYSKFVEDYDPTTESNEKIKRELASN